MILKRIKIVNILSIEETTIEFNSTGLTLIDGWNYDSERSNGAGKTSILNSISFALYDKIPRKISASEILRRDSKKGHAELHFAASDGSDWVVIRNRPKGVKFFKDSVELSLTQEEFEEHIRLNYDQFLASMYTAQGLSSTRFLALNDSDKKDMLVKLLKLDRFSILKKNADDKVKLISSDRDKVLTQIDLANSKISLYKENLIDHTNIEDEMAAIDAIIANLISVINESDNIESNADFDSQINEITNKLDVILESKVRRENLLEKFNDLSSNADRAIDSCELCGSTLSNELLLSHQKEKEAIKERLAAIKVSIDKFDTICSQESTLKSNLAQLRLNKRNAEQVVLNFRLRVNDARVKLSIQENRKNSLLEKLKRQDEVLVKIGEIEKLLKALEEKKDALDGDITVYKTVASLSSSTGIQAYVIDSIVDSLNQYISENIALLWPNMSYSISTHRENSKGELVAKLADSLSINGKASSLGSLSGGEYKALSLCVDLAIVSLIEKQFGIRLNPVMLDEPFDGLDTVGRELVLDLLNKMSSDRSIIVIDHASESKSMFSNVILISKRNGISTISISA